MSAGREQVWLIFDAGRPRRLTPSFVARALVRAAFAFV
jgi:hypothetical protein